MTYAICNWWAKGKLIWKGLLRFIAFSFTFRYSIEQFLKILLTILLEILSMINYSNSRILDYLLKYKISLGISLCIFVIFCVLLFLVILKGIWNMSYDEKNLVVTQGLNKKLKIFVILYYLHFFFIWTFISIMIFVTPFVNSLYLWMIVLIV